MTHEASKKVISLFSSIFLLILVPSQFHQSTAAKCVHSHNFNSLGDRGYLVSPKFPANYPFNTNCSYDITSPEGSQIEIKCDEFNLRPSISGQAAGTCDQQDKFCFSLHGNHEDKEEFCGQIKINETTKVNRLLASFQSGNVGESTISSDSNFRFNCTLTVVQQQLNDNLSSPPNPPTQIIEAEVAETNLLGSHDDCGVRNWDDNNTAEGIRIVGGTPASLGEFPWRCMLYTEELGAFCGCSVLSNSLIMTAAHCTAAVQGADALYVDLGDYDLSTTEETKNLMIPVAQVIQNEAYNPQTQDHDISLLRLENPIEFSVTIRPICLPWHLRHKNFHGSWVTASGWGITYVGGVVVSEILQKVDLPLLTSEECRKYYGNVVTDNMICTYLKGRDTCQGDSGSSIDYYDKETGRYYAVGIVSWGVGCAEDNEPGVYLKITNFLDWIQKNYLDQYNPPVSIL